MFGYAYKLNGYTNVRLGYESFEDAYTNYCVAMAELKTVTEAMGQSLADCDWRGVWSTEALLEILARG